MERFAQDGFADGANRLSEGADGFPGRHITGFEVHFRDALVVAV